MTDDTNGNPSCHRCGLNEIGKIKKFHPTSEEPDVIPMFCEECFLNDDVQGDEPTTIEEKIEMWREADYA